MSIFSIQSFLNKSKKEYKLPHYHLEIRHDNGIVYSLKKGCFFKNIINKKLKYFSVNQKILACLNLIMLSTTGKTSLDDNIAKYVSDFSGTEKLKDLINNYLDTIEPRNELKYFEIISRIVKKLIKVDISEYSKLMIIKPLKMNSTTFDTNGLITSINDYFKLCNNICNSGVHLTRHKDLQKSISVLSEIMSKYQNSCFSYIDINGIYTLIDVKHKIVAMYNQAPTRICNNQIDMLETLKSLIYDSCINHDFSKGYNLFP